MTAYSSPYDDSPVRFRQVITRADIDTLIERGQASLVLGERDTITDEAREHALKHGILIQQRDSKSGAPGQVSASVRPSAGAVPASGPVLAAQPAPAPARAADAAPAKAPPAAGEPMPPGHATTQAGIIEAVAAELHARGIVPTTALIQQVVSGVNRVLAASGRR